MRVGVHDRKAADQRYPSWCNASWVIAVACQACDERQRQRQWREQRTKWPRAGLGTDRPGGGGQIGAKTEKYASYVQFILLGEISLVTVGRCVRTNEYAGQRIPAHPIKPRAEPRVPSVIIRPLARSSSRPRPSPLPFHSRSLAPSSANFFLDRCCGHFPSRPSFPFSSTSNLLVREGTRSFSISVLLKKIAPRGSGTEFSVSRIGKLVRREEIAESAEWARIFGHRLRCSRERNWKRVPNPKDSRNKKA